MKTNLNLLVAWLWILLGFVSGMLLGLFFHHEKWLGGYASFKRRLYRFAHISFFGLGAVNLLLCLTTVLAGCASSPVPVVQQPPDEFVRGKFGRIGVLTCTRSTDFTIQLPASKSEAAGECAKQVGWGPGQASQDVAVIALAWIPVGSLAGGLYGAMKGESGHSLASGQAALAGAFQGGQFRTRLAEDVNHLAAEKTGRQLRTVPPECLVEHHITSAFSVVYFGNTYTNLAAHDIDTVLELEIIHPALEGADGVNPRLAFGVEVKARILAAAGNQLLYCDGLQYRSPEHCFSEWAANDAYLLRSEIQSSLEQMSGEIINQIFVRTTQEDFPANSNLQRYSP